MLGIAKQRSPLEKPKTKADPAKPPRLALTSAYGMISDTAKPPGLFLLTPEFAGAKPRGNAEISVTWHHVALGTGRVF
jgi:hypothetical protein